MDVDLIVTVPESLIYFSKGKNFLLRRANIFLLMYTTFWTGGKNVDGIAPSERV